MVLLRNERRVLLISLLVTVLGAAALGGFRIETNLSTFYPADDPTIQLTNRLYGETPIPRLLTVVFRSPDPALIDETLPAVVEALRGSPHLSRVIATKEEWFGERVDWALQAPLYFISDESRQRLKARLAGPDRRPALEASRRRMAEDPLAGKEVVLRDPLGLRWLFEEAKDPQLSGFPAKFLRGSAYLVFEKPAIDKPAIGVVRLIGRQDWMILAFSEALLADLRPRIEGALAGTAIQYEMLGGYATALYHNKQVRDDLLHQSVMSMVLVLVFLVFFTRSIKVPLLVVAGMSVAILCTLSFGGFILGPLTPLTVSLAAILVAQGVEFPIRFYTRYRREREVHFREAAFENTHVSLGKLQIGAAATSVVAFLALLSSRFPGIREFGLLLTLGLILCLIVSLTVVPLLIVRIDRMKQPRPAPVPLIVRLAKSVALSRAGVPAAILVLLLGAATWILVSVRGVKLDLDPRSIAPPDDPGGKAFDRLEAEMGVSLFPVFVLVDEKTPFARMREASENLRRKGLIGWYDGPQQLFPPPEVREKVEAFRAETAGWVEATLGDLAALGFRPDPFRKGLYEVAARFVGDPPAAEALGTGRWAPLGRSFTWEQDGRKFWVLHLFPSRNLLPADARADFNQEVRAELGPDVRFLSDEHMADYYADLLGNDLLVLSGVTALAVIIVSFFVVGNLKGGFLSILPVGIATGVTLAASILFVGPLNLINMIAVPMVIGLAVHDGTYYAGHLRGHRYRGPEEAMLDVGPGIWGSAATTILGFAAIVTSVSPGLVSMGILVAVGRAAALVATLLLLPALWKGDQPPPALPSPDHI